MPSPSKSIPALSKLPWRTYRLQCTPAHADLAQITRLRSKHPPLPSAALSRPDEFFQLVHRGLDGLQHAHRCLGRREGSDGHVPIGTCTLCLLLRLPLRRTGLPLISRHRSAAVFSCSLLPTAIHPCFGCPCRPRSSSSSSSSSSYFLLLLLLLSRLQRLQYQIYYILPLACLPTHLPHPLSDCIFGCSFPRALWSVGLATSPPAKPAPRRSTWSSTTS